MCDYYPNDWPEDEEFEYPEPIYVYASCGCGFSSMEAYEKGDPKGLRRAVEKLYKKHDNEKPVCRLTPMIW